MNLRQFKNYIRLVDAVKLYQLFYYRFIIEIGESFRNKFALSLNTGRRREVIIAAEIIFIK